MSDALGGLPAFLRVLALSPSPDEVAAAVVDGPGSVVSGRACAILWARPPSLVVLGLHGYQPDEVAGLETIPLEADYPLARAFREGEVLVDDPAELADLYAGLRRADTRWDALRNRIPVGSVISAPIVSRGRVVGAYALNCEGKTTWTTLEVALLDAVSSALGMWITHPDSGLPLDDDAREAPALTARQQAMLELVAEGKTNSAIATALGYSDSTVKQELARAMSALQVTDRSAAVRRAGALGLIHWPAP